jgi:MoxR-like ATPase
MLRLVTEGRTGNTFVLEGLEPVVEAEDVLRLQRIASRLEVDREVYAYAVRIARETRQRIGIAQGAGPRATISLLRAAKAHALLEGNGFVTPDDVKRVAPAVLRHRIQLTADLEIEGAPADEIIAALLEDVPAPRI